MASPKSKRTAPPKNMNDYVVHRLEPAYGGLSGVPDEAFENVSGMEYTPSNPTTYWQTLSSVQQLGFNVTIDGVSYNTVQISPCGWLVMNDSSVGATTLGALGLSTGYDTYNFNISGGRHLVLSPWGSRLRGLQSSYPKSASSPLATRVKFGYEVPPKSFGYNERAYGVQICSQLNHELGRRFVVRWNVVTDVDSNLDMRSARFECVIYECGRIEFRYDVKSEQLTVFADEASGAANFAAVGLFASGTAASQQFRDLSIYMNYDVTRSMYPLGGTVFSAAYSDFGTSYGRFLTYANNWTAGSLVLTPPANRRKINRAALAVLDAQSSYPQTFEAEKRNQRSLTGFRDGDSPTYTTQSIDVMVGMPRLFGDGTSRALARNDVFGTLAGLTSSAVVSRYASDRFAAKVDVGRIEAFNDERVTDPASTFALSGSDQNLYDGILTGELRQKKRFDLEFHVNHRTTLLPITASLHYLDVRTGMWRLPPRTTSVSTTTSSLNANSDLEAFFANESTNFLTDYDSRGWDSTGQFTLSATLNFRSQKLANPSIADYTTQNITAYLSSGSINEAVTTSQRYDADDNFYLEIPITSPFLLEKAEITLPLEAGPGWFSDVTATGRRFNTSSIRDKGGPALTFVVLHEQKNDACSRRNIIMSGTITHTFDNVKSLEVYQLEEPATGISSSIILSGFRHHGMPNAVVSVPNTASFFTGSVTLQIEAMTSCGLTSFYETSFGALPIETLLSSSTLNPSYITTVNPFGRAKTGMNVDASTPYGKEFLGLESTYPNPFSPLNGTDVSAVASHIAISGSGMRYKASGLVSNVNCKQSPYLIRPGDKLLFAISKGRPWYPINRRFPVLTSRYSEHDVKLGVGKIKASFFGTHLQAERERLIGLEQDLTSNAIHQVVGDDPVTDQFIGSYSGLYAGTMRDDYVTGTMVSIGPTRGQFVTGTRARWFSKHSAQTVIQPATSSLNVYGNTGFPDFDDYLLTGSEPPVNTLSTILRPVFELANSPRVLSITSDSERFYDSMPPSFTDCTAVNGGKIIFSEFIGPIILLDIILFGSASFEFVDFEWMRSFPTEPQYHGIKRIKEQRQRYVAKHTFSGSAVESIPPLEFEEAYVYSLTMYPGLTSSAIPYILGDVEGYYDDGTHVPKGSNSFDITQYLYGFGDANIIHGGPSTGIGTHGVANAPGFRLITGTISSQFGISPVIRGWKYGLISAFPEYSRTYWRPDSFGQPRDMLEQRLDTKYYDQITDSTYQSPVQVRFVSSDGRLTLPENTLSQNLSLECTSSAPFTDSIAVERASINANVVNKGIISLKANEFGNVTF